MHSRRVVLGLAALYGVTLLLIGLWPTHVDEGLNAAERPPTVWLVNIFGLSPWTAYNIGEFSANVLLFAPLGALALALRPHRGWTGAVIIGASASCAIELTQLIARPDRTGSLRDVIANTLGTALGAGLLMLWLRLKTRNRTPV